MLSRKVGAKIVCYMSKVTEHKDYMRIYIPFVKKSAQDANWEVRYTISEEIPFLCNNFNNIPMLYEILYKLIEDQQQEVFVSAATSLGLILNKCRDTAISKQAIEKFKVVLSIPNSETFKATLKNIGKVLIGIGKEALDKDLKSILKNMILMALEKDLRESGVLVAQNLPAIVLVYGPEGFIAELFKVIERLMSSKAESLARATFASCFHEIVKLFGYDLATEKLRDYFFSLLTDQEIIVVDGILNNIETIIEIFASKQDSNTFIKDYFSILPQLHKTIKAKSWRTESKFLQKLTFILKHLNAEHMSDLIPIFKSVFSSSSPECKQNVSELLVHMLTGFCQWPIRSEVHLMAEELAKSKTYQDRMLYLGLCSVVIKRMSKHYFRENFLRDMLALGNDKVIGVLWRFCCIAGEVKRRILVEDIKNLNKLIMIVEKIIKTTKSQCLKEKAESILKELRIKELSNIDNKKEEELLKKERDNMRKEILQQGNTKKLGIGNGKIKEAHLVSSVTAMTSNSELVARRKPSMKSTHTSTKLEEPLKRIKKDLK